MGGQCPLYAYIFVVVAADIIVVRINSSFHRSFIEYPRNLQFYHRYHHRYISSYICGRNAVGNPSIESSIDRSRINPLFLFRFYLKGGDEGEYDPSHRGQSRAVLKKPKISLLSFYHCNWKTRINHFQTYAEIKVKEEKKASVSELANQVSY